MAETAVVSSSAVCLGSAISRAIYELRKALDDWRRDGSAEPLSQRMGSMLDVLQEALVDHIRRLGSR